MKLSHAFDHTPPAELEAEQAVIGCCLVDGESKAVKTVLPLLSPDDFYRDAHGAIWRAIRNLADRSDPTDVLMVASELERNGTLDFAGGRLYLVACVETVPAVTRAPIYARMVRESAGLRRAIDEFGKLIGAAYEGTEVRELAGKLRAFAPVLDAYNGKGALGGVDLPKTWTGREVSDMEIPPLKWAVEGLIPEGLTLLVGRSKLGKSWLALQLGEAVALGGHALGSIPVEQGDVLYVALEDTLRRLKSRQRTLLDELMAPDRIHFAPEWPQMSQGGLVLLAEWLRRHPETRLAVIDTLGRWRGAPDPRAQVFYDDTAVVARVKRIADDHGCAIVMIHHTNKGKRDDAFEGVSGSTGIMAAADGTIIFERQRGKSEAILKITGRDVEESEKGISWDPHAGWTFQGDAKEFMLTRQQAETLDVLRRAARPMKAAEVGPILGIPTGTAKQRLYRLADAGAASVTDGYFAISPIDVSGNTAIPLVTECNSVTPAQDDPWLSTE